MKIYECDFCQKQKPCTAIHVDAKAFDICVQCRSKMNKKLENRGEPIGWRYMWNGQLGYHYPWTVYTVPMPSVWTIGAMPITSTITTTSGLTGINSQMSNTQTCSGMLSLSGTIES